MRKYKWGILGLGKIANKFAQDLVKIPNAELYAVASRSIERGKAFAEKYDVPNYFDSYETMIKNANLDVVYIATPHVFHSANTLLCLENKVAVLCEKPFAINAHQVNQMIQTAEVNDIFLMEAFWTRCLPSMKKVLELIQAGKIGEVNTVKADFGFKAPVDYEARMYNNQLGGGSLLDIGIYPIFLALLILGKPKAIKAIAKIGTSKVDETCEMLFQYENGKSANLSSTILNVTTTEAFIYGTKGTIHIPQRWHESKRFSLLENGQPVQEFSFDDDVKGYKYEAEEVMRCLTENKKQSDLLPLSFSRDLIELLDKVRTEIGLVYPQDNV